MHPRHATLTRYEHAKSGFTSLSQNQSFEEVVIVEFLVKSDFLYAVYVTREGNYGFASYTDLKDRGPVAVPTTMEDKL